MHETNIKSLDLNLLVALEALLKTQSVSRAAETVNLSQPAMSRALERLRHVLKDPVLVRAGRGMRLTPRGEALQGPVDEAMSRIRAIMGPQGFDPESCERVFDIVTADYISYLFLPRLLQSMIKQAPKVSLNVLSQAESSLAGISSGDLDLAIGVIGTGADFENNYSQSLFEDRVVCIMRKGHPLSRSPLTLSGFTSARHAFLSISGRGGGSVDEKLKALGLSRHIALRLPHFLAIHTMVAQTDLIATVPLRLALGLAHDSLDIVDLPEEVQIDRFTISQIWHERFHRDPAHVWLRGVIKTLSTEQSPMDKAYQEMSLPQL